MKKGSWLFSIRMKLSLAFCLVVALPMLSLFLISFQIYKNETEQAIRISAQQTLAQGAANVENFVDQMIAASNTIYLSQEVKQILRNDLRLDSHYGSTYALSDFNVIHSIVTVMETSSLTQFTPYVTLVDSRGRIYRNRQQNEFMELNELKQSDWYLQSVAQNGYLVWMAAHNPSQDAKTYVTLSRLIKDALSGQNAVLQIAIPQRDVHRQLFADSETEASRWLLVDQDGMIISAADEQLCGSRYDLGELEQNAAGDFISHKNGEKLFFSSRTIQGTGWQLIQLLSYDHLFGRMTHTSHLMLTATLLLMALFLLMSTWLIFRFLKPLLEMRAAMQKVAEGDLTVRCRPSGRDEIYDVVSSFNEMTQQLQGYVEQIREEEKRKEELTLKALQAQINPHFLFNTLNAIRMVANMNQDMAVENLLIALGKLLHVSMDKGGILITIAKEMEALQSYVMIQKIRFSQKFSISYEVETETLECLIPRLTLQPIVENSFIHAFNDQHRYLTICVRCRREKDTLVIEVLNDGASLEDTANRNDREKFSGMGLKNVDQRLKLQFGSQYGVHIANREEGGTRTAILMPALMQEGGADHV